MPVNSAVFKSMLTLTPNGKEQVRCSKQHPLTRPSCLIDARVDGYLRVRYFDAQNKSALSSLHLISTDMSAIYDMALICMHELTKLSQHLLFGVAVERVASKRESFGRCR